GTTDVPRVRAHVSQGPGAMEESEQHTDCTVHPRVVPEGTLDLRCGAWGAGRWCATGSLPTAATLSHGRVQREHAPLPFPVRMTRSTRPACGPGRRPRPGLSINPSTPCSTNRRAHV